MQVICHGKVRAYEPQGIYQLYVESITPAGRRRPAPAVRGAARQARGGGPVRGRAQAAAAALAAADRGGHLAGRRGVARHRQRHAPALPDRRAGAVADDRAGADRGRGDRARAAARCTPAAGSTSSSWRAAAARSRTCGRSTTSGWCGRWSRRRCRSWSASATSRTSRWPTSRPTCARPTPTAAAEQAVPDMPQFPAILARLRDRASAAHARRPGRSRQLPGRGGARARPGCCRTWRPLASAPPSSSTAATAPCAAASRASATPAAAWRTALRALSPAATLERGYAVARLADGTIVRDPAQATRGEPLEVVVARGTLATRVERSPTDEELLP